MRVALIPSAYAPAVGGVEELTHRLAQRLMAAGDEVQVWTVRHPSSLPHEEVVEGVTVRRFEMPMPAATASQLLRWSQRAPEALARLLGATRGFRPDLMHVQCFSANGLYATAVSTVLGVPFVVSLQGETVMDDHDIYERSSTLRAGLRIGLRRADAVTGCSSFVLRDAARFGLAAGAGEVVPNGVETEDAAWDEMLDVPFDRYVFSVGRFVAKKGFDLLLDAFAGLAAHRPDVGLVIGGDGAARAPLARQVRDLGLQDRVLLPGTLSRGQVRWALRRASLFVLPSRVEPFGIVVVEALHAGCPVIVSGRGGAREIVRHEQDGLVVDPFDRTALQGAMTRLLDDERLCDRLTAAGTARAQDFAWSRVAERYQDVYARAVAARRR